MVTIKFCEFLYLHKNILYSNKKDNGNHASTSEIVYKINYPIEQRSNVLMNRISLFL